MNAGINSLFFEMVCNVSNKVTVHFEIDGKEVSGLIDTGASSNVIPLHVVLQNKG